MSVGVRELETDVLILGGGLAALRAAIAAVAAGARVTVMTKGTAGRAGSSAITSAGFSVAIGQEDPADSPQSHFADTIRGGGSTGGGWSRSSARRLRPGSGRW